VVRFETDVPVGHDAEQHAVGRRHRHTGNAEPGTQALHVGDGGVGAAGHRVGDHAGLGPFHHVDLLRLVLDGQVAVQYAHAALAGHGHRHPRLGHGVHGR
jgi:hypothetical protein